MVRYKHLNLTDPHAIQRFHRADIILCANVLIYFDAETKQAVITNLYDRLQRGGYLFVGTSETLHGVTRALKPVRFTNTIAYQKEESS
jgi:chemotaxis protein methyltransferase CheR